MDKSRRKFIKQISLMAAAGAYMKFAGAPAFAFPQEAVEGLAALARKSGREFGCCVSPNLLKNNPEYAAAIKRDCTILVAENAMKWKNLNPSQGVYNFAPADEIVDFAEKNNMNTRFHTLVWHKSFPVWVNGTVTDKASAEKALRDYADHVFPHYRGKMRSWDIVNEPLKVKDLKPSGMRASLWYKTLGPDYVAQAFRLAKEYDPGGDLVLNEYGLETGDIAASLKRGAFLELVRKLKDRDVPVDAVGLQSHLVAHMDIEAKDKYQSWLQELKETGVKIYVTELDIDERKVAGDAAVRAATAAKYVEEYLSCILEVSTLEEIVMWGIWDGSTFINWQKKPDQVWGQPLLYTKDWQKNPLWHTMANFLKRQ